MMKGRSERMKGCVEVDEEGKRNIEAEIERLKGNGCDSGIEGQGQVVKMLTLMMMMLEEV